MARPRSPMISRETAVRAGLEVIDELGLDAFSLPSLAKKLGVKVDELLISQPDSGEQALEIADTLVRSGAVEVLVIDSVAALTPRLAAALTPPAHLAPTGTMLGVPFRRHETVPGLVAEGGEIDRGERVGARRGEGPGRDDLVDVAGRDMLLEPGHDLLIGLVVLVDLDTGDIEHARGRCRLRLRRSPDRLDGRHRRGQGPGGIVIPGVGPVPAPTRGDDGRGAVPMIDYREPVRDPELEQWLAQRIGPPGGQRLEVVDGVVADAAGQEVAPRVRSRREFDAEGQPPEHVDRRVGGLVVDDPRPIRARQAEARRDLGGEEDPLPAVARGHRGELALLELEDRVVARADLAGLHHPIEDAHPVVSDRDRDAGSGGLDRPGGWIDMTRAVRSPGSALKPFIYGFAFEDGLAAPDTQIDDSPRRFGDYQPENFDRVFRGKVQPLSYG